MAAVAVEIGISTDSASVFALEQSAGLVLLLVLAWYLRGAASAGWWIGILKPDLLKWYYAALSCLSGIIACVPGGGVLIAKIMRPFAGEIGDDNIAGLTQGGRYIGWLERILVFLLVLMDQPNGIGFLLAAKSILRFGEIREQSQRKVAEYIIIGTFVSFGWALFISVLTRKAIGYWLGQ